MTQLRYQTFSYDGKPRKAVFVGVNDYGNLICLTPDGLRTFKPGKVENLNDVGEMPMALDKIEAYLEDKLDDRELETVIDMIEDHIDLEVDEERDQIWEDGYKNGVEEGECNAVGREED
jgi:hypothetical protein